MNVSKKIFARGFGFIRGIIREQYYLRRLVLTFDEFRKKHGVM